MGTDQASVTFLKAKEILSFSTGLHTEDLTADPLKSGKTFCHFDSIVFCHGIYQVGSYDSLDQLAVFRQASFQCLFLTNLILCQKTSGHITGKADILS